MTLTEPARQCNCAETARDMKYDDLEWFCWMFGCDVCAAAKINCGRPS